MRRYGKGVFSNLYDKGLALMSAIITELDRIKNVDYSGKQLPFKKYAI
jgi:hypothetical protein